LASKKSKSNLSAAAQARLKAFEAKQQLQSNKEIRRKSDNRIAIIASVVVVLLALGSQLSYFGFGPGSITASPTPSGTSTASASATPVAAPSACLKQPVPATSAKTAAPTTAPAVSVAEKRVWSGSMYVNNCKLSISIDGVHAPHAAANFIALAKSGFYNNVVCHRLTTSNIYVLQCGDPKGDGTGGPGYSFGPNNENVPTKVSPVSANYVTYARGVLAMANSGGTATQGSQFFIVYQDTPLPPSYSVFGNVTAGLVTIQSLAAQGVAGGSGDGKPNLAATLGPIVLK
jgi:peptidyl-prolyl cis-trans isomerase B (cyclophilin B)